jgi:aspartate racemase
MYGKKAKGGNFTKELGVIGGMGPLATAYFMELVVRMTDAAADSEHIPMIILNRPETPDRTSYIVGKSSDSPLEAMIKAGNQLADFQVDYIAIPCVTAYYFYRQLQEGIRAPVINMIGETAVCLKEEGIRKVGLMATDGTISSGFFREGLIQHGICVVEPSAEGQKRVMDIIYGSIKANRPVKIEDFNRVDRELRGNGAEAVILGCTELSMIHRDFPLGSGFLDSMEALARKSVLACEGRLKKEYLHLVTK